jgi:hypothetical protein
MQRCTPAVTQTEIDEAIAAAKAMGPLKDTTMASLNVDATGSGAAKWELIGVATFTKDAVPYHATLEKQGEEYKIVSFGFAPPQNGQRSPQSQK